MTFDSVQLREVDLDPPPRRWRTNADGVLLAAAANPAVPGDGRQLLTQAWPAMTADQRRRRLRDLLIVFGSEVCGLSERELAEVTGLARSRVHSIREKFQAPMGQGGD